MIEQDRHVVEAWLSVMFARDDYEYALFGSLLPYIDKTDNVNLHHFFKRLNDYSTMSVTYGAWERFFEDVKGDKICGVSCGDEYMYRWEYLFDDGVKDRLDTIHSCKSTIQTAARDEGFGGIFENFDSLATSLHIGTWSHEERQVAFISFVFLTIKYAMSNDKAIRRTMTAMSYNHPSAWDMYNVFERGLHIAYLALFIPYLQYDEGYVTIKGFDKNLQCMGFQYEVGKEYSVGGEIKMCENGIHAIRADVNPLNVFKYYPMYTQGRYCVVRCDGFVTDADGGDKIVCSKIKVLEEIDIKEIFEIERFLKKYGIIDSDCNDGNEKSAIQYAHEFTHFIDNGNTVFCRDGDVVIFDGIGLVEGIIVYDTFERIYIYNMESTRFVSGKSYILRNGKICDRVTLKPVDVEPMISYRKKTDVNFDGNGDACEDIFKTEYVNNIINK